MLTHVSLCWQGVAFRSFATDDGPLDRGFAVKVLDLDTQELEIYERLLDHLDSPQNHTIPCEIVRNGHPMLIMPLLSRIEYVIVERCSSLSGLLDIFYQIIEVRIIPLLVDTSSDPAY